MQSLVVIGPQIKEKQKGAAYMVPKDPNLNRVNPPHFYTSSGLVWQACLKKTEVSLELLTDPDMLLMFE